MGNFFYKASKFVDDVISSIANLSEFHIILIASIFFILILVSFFIIIILKILGNKAKNSGKQDLEIFNSINERIDKLETVIQGLQQDRARYQQGVTNKINEITDNIEVITNVLDQKSSKESKGIDPLNFDELREPKFKGRDPVSSRETVKLQKDDSSRSLQDNKTKVVEAENIPHGNKTEEVEVNNIPTTDKTQEIKASFEKGLKKTKTGFFVKIKDLFSGREAIDSEDLEELEAILVSSDMGISMTQYFLDRLKEDDLTSGITKEGLIFKLKKYIIEVLDSNGSKRVDLVDGPAGHVVLCVGVNGVGKTTTVAKLASKYKREGKKVLLVAADTFRAAAVEQLEAWANKIEVDIVKGNEGAKPASVIFDAMEKAKSENFNVVLVDTAGRLHNKSNLMQELEGIRNVVRKTDKSAPHEVLLVVDGSTGQNALIQAKEFKTAVQPTGLVVTKLDGTPKGGIVVAIQHECDIPVNFIGLGEKQEDLREFNADNFVNVLFEEDTLY